MPTKHARLNASASKRWMECAGSVRLAEQFPQGSSIYADEGTLAHTAAEQLIKTGEIKKAHREAIDKFYSDHPDMAGSSEAVLKDLEPYRDYVLEEFADEARQDPATQLMVEEQVDLSAYIPGGFGTSDVIIVREGRLHIIDLKYGKGVLVSAEDNPQLRLYALGALSRLDLIYDIEDVVMTIYQPRLDNISTATITAAELYDWGENEVKPAADLALTEDAPFKAGDHCQFCPAKNDCKARADHNMELVSYLARTLLTLDDIGRLLGRVDELTRWADDLKTGALSKALAGEEIPGWKVVEGRSIRKYAGTDDKIAEVAEAAGYDHAMLYESKLLTVSAMEKMMGKKQFAEVLGGYIDKPAGKPTLAPESDKRPAITNNSAAEDFADEN